MLDAILKCKERNGLRNYIERNQCKVPEAAVVEMPGKKAARTKADEGGKDGNHGPASAPASGSRISPFWQWKSRLGSLFVSHQRISSHFLN